MEEPTENPETDPNPGDVPEDKALLVKGTEEAKSPELELDLDPEEDPPDSPSDEGRRSSHGTSSVEYQTPETDPERGGRSRRRESGVQPQVSTVDEGEEGDDEEDDVEGLKETIVLQADELQDLGPRVKDKTVEACQLKVHVAQLNQTMQHIEQQRSLMEAEQDWYKRETRRLHATVLKAQKQTGTTAPDQGLKTTFKGKQLGSQHSSIFSLYSNS